MQRRKNRDLTRGEEQIMQILWHLGEGNVSEIIAKIEEPKPAYTTVATFMKILEEKDFVDRKPSGRSFTYFPLIDKQTYAQRVLSNTLNNYFQGSITQLVAYYLANEQIDEKTRQELVQLIQ